MMKTFYLYREVNGRWVIDETFPNNAHRVKKVCSQPCWLAAKKKFGFALSATQDWVLSMYPQGHVA